MSTFYALCSMEIAIIIVILAWAAYWACDYLKIIKNQLYKLLDNVRPIDNSITNAWSTILSIRNDTAKISGLLDKDEEDEEHADTDISEEGWTMAPCPVCGGPARMRYDHNSMGYFVQCGRNVEYNTCDYSNIAGGTSMKIAADMWNKSAVIHYRMQTRGVDNAENSADDLVIHVKEADICKS